MRSWRDRASPQAQADLDHLVGPALDFARQQLARYGTFYPYAVAIDADSQQQVYAADPGTPDPDPDELMSTLRGHLIAQRGELRAAAIASDVRVPELGSDAIRVDLEHREGVALSVVLPYRGPQSPGAEFSYGELQAFASAPVVWPG